MNLIQLWPAIVGLVGWLSDLFSPTVQEAVKDHPVEAGAVALILTTVANMVKSPKQ